MYFSRLIHLHRDRFVIDLDNGGSDPTLFLISDPNGLSLESQMSLPMESSSKPYL